MIGPRMVLGWVTSTMLLKRWQFIGIALALGTVFAVVLYLGKTEADHAKAVRDRLARSDRRQQAQIRAAARDRKRLANAIRRLQRLEHPSRAALRREIDRLIGALKHLTPVEAQRLRAVLLKVGRGPVGSAPPQSRTLPGGDGGGGGGSPQPPSPRPSPPGGGSPSPPVTGPSPPPLRSPPSPPGLDLPPIDPDGSGPLPTVDPPSIPLPPLPVRVR